MIRAALRPPFLFLPLVMAALVAAIHVFNRCKDVDARHEAGHDVMKAVTIVYAASSA
jgi:hypothetical protein